MGVFLKNHVLELKKSRFRKAKGVSARKRDIEVLDYPFLLFLFSCVYSWIRIDVSFRRKASRYQVKSTFFEIFETLKVKSPRSETAAGTHKTETFPIPRFLCVIMSSKEAIFYVLSTKEDMVGYFPIDNEDNIEEEESEVTVMDKDDFRNECMR